MATNSSSPNSDSSPDIRIGSAFDFKPKRRMTRWFEPIAMFSLVLRIWSTRRMEDQRAQHPGDDGDDPTAHRAQDPRVFDFAQTDGDFWFDYVADLGDAFDPTMCVAWHLGRTQLQRSDIDPDYRVDPEFGIPDLDIPGLDLREPEGAELDLRGPQEGAAPSTRSAEDVPDVFHRGQVLLMGGDLVYPNSSRARYRNQTLGPYGLAFEQSADSNEPAEAGLLAIPANHDWYGGIGPFREAFCRQDRIGGWRTAQHCSWWSARLAHDWWVWGLDTGLDGTINPAQFDYFRSVRDEMPNGARLIVCLPVPPWRLRERFVDQFDTLARFFFGLGLEPEVYLSGDHHISALHRRVRSDGEIEWHLTDGGGGAFQHPVHNLDREIPSSHGGLPEPEIAEEAPFELIASWPTNAESRAGTGGWWHLLFDRAAASLVGLLTLIQLGFMALVGADHRAPADLVRSVTETALDHLVPYGAITSLAVIAATTFGLARASSSSRGAMSWARGVGFFHGVAQAGVLAGAQLGGNLMVRRVLDSMQDGTSAVATAAVTWAVLVVAAVAGAVVSIIVLGTYLRVANRQFRMHDNESYSARASGDNRHFARFRITPDGALSCYVIAFRHTGSGWFESLAEDPSKPPESTSEPTLIDVRFRTSPSDRSGIDGAQTMERTA